MFLLTPEEMLTIRQHVASAQAQSSMRDDPASIWMLKNGSAKQNVPDLSPQDLAPFDSNQPTFGSADVTHSFRINQTDIVTWVVDRAPFLEPKIPIISGNTSDGWRADTTIHMPSNATVDIIMRIANDSMDMVRHLVPRAGHTVLPCKAFGSDC